jgi:putative transposase
VWSKRGNHSPEFKVRVAIEAISGRKTIQEIAADHASASRKCSASLGATHPGEPWEWQLLDGVSERFTRGKKTRDKEEGQAKKAELFQQSCVSSRRLRLCRSLTARAVADGAGVSPKNLSCSGVRELRKLVDHDHPELSVSRQFSLLDLPRSTLYCRSTSARESMLQIMAGSMPST